MRNHPGLEKPLVGRMWDLPVAEVLLKKLLHLDLCLMNSDAWNSKARIGQ